MTIYTYSNAAFIDEVEIITNEQGGVRAYVHAREGITSQDITNIQQQFALKGWVGVPMSRNGKPCLELRGFKKEKDLQEFLVQRGWTSSHEATAASKDEKPKNAWDKFLAATLKWSGIAYIAGDFSFLTYAGMEQYDHGKKFRAIDTAHAELERIGEQGSEALTRTIKAHRSIRAVQENLTLSGKYSSANDIPIKILKEEIDAAKTGAKYALQSGHSKIISGLGYLAGSLVLAGYGSKDQSRIEIKKSLDHIENFLKREGLINANNSQQLLGEKDNKNKNIFERANDFIKRYPSEILNTIYTGVGLALMFSSLKAIRGMSGDIKSAKKALDDASGASSPVREYLKDTVDSLKKDRGGEIIDIGLGAVTASSALAGILIKEKRPIEGEKKPEGLFAKAWNWIEEQPLRVTGYGYMLATAFHAWASFEKWKPNLNESKALAGGFSSERNAELVNGMKFRRKTLIGRSAFIASNILAEILLVLSSKGHGEGVRPKDIDDSVISAAADFVARQPQEKQEPLIERLAGFMAAPDIVGRKAEDIAAELRIQVAGIADNPWAQMQRDKQPVKEVPIAAEVMRAQQVSPATKVSAVNMDAKLINATPAHQLALSGN